MQAQENSSEGNSCSGTFSKENVVGHHSGIHNDEKPFKCNICQKTFASKCTLGGHAQTHNGKKSHKCNICQKTFARKDTLVCHARTHTGEKPYKCNICQKAFTCSSDMKRHVRRHTGEKPYKCKICEKTFPCSSDMSRHVRTHTEDKPYKCNICQKTFAVKISLDNHTLTQHTRPYILCYIPVSHKGDLDIDRANYTGEKTSPCIVNCRIISCDSNLKRHITSCIEDNSCICVSGLNIVSTKECQCARIKSDDRLTEYGNSLHEQELSPAEATGMQKSSSLQGLTPSSDEKQLYEDRSCDFIHFTLRPYGCGMCDEMFEIENEFMDHCSRHSVNACGNDTFSELFPMRLLSYVPRVLEAD